MPLDQIPEENFIFDCYDLKALKKIRFKVLQRCSSGFTALAIVTLRSFRRSSFRGAEELKVKRS